MLPALADLDLSLEERICVVTGAASGIGAGIASKLAAAGATVVIADRDQAGAEETCRAIVQAGGRAQPVHIDLAEEASVVAGCCDIVARIGPPWLLVNNAGLFDGELLLEGTTAHWDRLYAVNARGAFLMTRECGRAMAEAAQGGRIVNIASRSIQGRGVPGLSAYVASKSALAGLSMTSAAELVKYAITVNTVLPGSVFTPGAAARVAPALEGPRPSPPPLGWCEPHDIAAAVLFFATPAARFITNQVIAVDAGKSLI